MEITATQIIGLNVYSLEQGEKIGQVRHYLFDTKEKELIALIVTNKKIIKEESILCLSDVAGLSEEAVTVDSPKVLRKKADCPHLKDLLKSPPIIEGLSLLKKDGTFLGRAADCRIDTETGKITRIRLNGGLWSNLLKDRVYLPIDAIEIIGSDMILAKDDAEITEEQNRRRPSPHKVPQQKKDRSERGCGERIMAMSGKDLFHRHRETVFPDIPKEEPKEE